MSGRGGEGGRGRGEGVVGRKLTFGENRTNAVTLALRLIVTDMDVRRNGT